MRKKRSFLAVMGLLVGTMSFAGGTAAYLSKSAGEVKNVFTAGSVKAQLTEAHWDTQKASKVYPGQILEKYIYGYKSVLNPGESTTPLFRKLAAVSYLEGELDASVSYDVPVIASVIQEQDGSKTMKEIYQEYLKQADIDQKEARG